MNYPNLERLIEIVKILRSPDGCPWDKEQTHKTLRPNMLEEAYEAVDAIDENDIEHLKEELGDVLLQVVLHAQIGKDESEFDIEDIAKLLNEKLIRRHPHIFGDEIAKTPEEVLINWEKIKKEEKKDRISAMDGLSKAQSALISAQKISKRAVKTGFEWECEADLYNCIMSEFEEFRQACKNSDKDNMEEEMGDILFAIVNLARWNNIDAEQALITSNNKFVKRFRKMEELKNKPLNEYSPTEFEELWQKAKGLC